MNFAIHAAVTVQTALTILAACTPQPPAKPASTAPAAPIERKPLSAVLAEMRQEISDMEAVIGSTGETAKALGILNGKLQSLGYFRRVPSTTSLDALRSQIEALAVDRMLRITGFDGLPMPNGPPATAAPVLGPGQPWQPTLDQLRERIAVTIDLQGRLEDVAQFIDLLPARAERLLIVTGSQPMEGGIRLLAEAYAERELAQPRVLIEWPPLADRLRAAGWNPDDRSVRADPAWPDLESADAAGRSRLPDARHALQITADFPRWLLRAQFYDERSTALTTTRGDRLLGTIRR
jgi:hypothetical protein